MRRRAAALLAAIVLPAAAGPPAVNLRVEMRVVEQAQARRAEGSVVIGTRGSTPVVGGSVRIATDSGGRDEVQQVLVLNGAAASLRTSAWRALPTGEWFWGAGNPGMGQTRQWVDAGRGFSVQPSWAGGDAAVQVEIASAGDTSAHTRLALPLGEWLVFARRGEATSETQLQLQLRVSLPPR